MTNTIQIFLIAMISMTGLVRGQEKIHFFNPKSSSPLLLEVPKNYDKYFDEIYRRESTEQDSKIQTLSDMHMIMGIKNENFDYGSGDKENNDNQEKYEITPNFLSANVQQIIPSDRKHQLRDTSATLVPNNFRQITNQEKQIYEKRNNYYMALCHFKICNMGRKRNSRFLHL